MNRCHEINLKELPVWNWGAFLLTWIWGTGNGVWISLFALIPGVNFIVAIFLGFFGYRLAWDRNRCFDLNEFLKVQKLWAKWAFILTGIVIVSGGSSVIYGISKMKYWEKRELENNIRIIDVKTVMAQVNNYKADNGEKCPENLNVLVPKYISGIPDSILLEPDSYRINGNDCYIGLTLQGNGGDLASDSTSGRKGFYEQKSESKLQMNIWGAE